MAQQLVHASQTEDDTPQSRVKSDAFALCMCSRKTEAQSHHRCRNNQTKTQSILTSGVACTVRKNSATNHGRLYWYMGSMPAKSAMQKKSRLARTATERYCSLAASISSSVRSASSTLLAMSLLVACAVKHLTSIFDKALTS